MPTVAGQSAISAHWRYNTTMNRFGYNTGQVVQSLRERNDDAYRRFIESHVRRLLDSGPRFIMRSYRRKARTVSEHLLKLYNAQIEAERFESPYSLGLVRYYVRELNRLNAELRILEDAMHLAGIPYR